MAKVSLRTYNREIESMLDRGQLDEVVAHCHHILKSFPKHLETYRLLGKAYLELKKYGDAVDIFSRVLVSVPNDFVAHVGMSIIRDEENKLDDAIWHMERAFETQPSNAAIQGELQRLYGRRDGVQPPRIRMTRGALANMYVQGELYPQAISEIKGVLVEDPGRSDMQSLLARACYRSGQKNEAAEVASALLRTYPYSLDANRVLVEILGMDRPDAVQTYRQRVIELDPYAAHVTGSIFQSNDAPDSAIALERLDWNNQPVEQQADWRTNQGIEPEAGTAIGEQPEWLRDGFEDANAAPPTTPAGTPIFDSSFSTGDNIPEFLREAGWEKSTGASEEGMPPFDEDTIPPTQAVPTAEEDLPDWVRAMAPTELSKPVEEEDLPDWISKIGPGVLATPSDSTSITSDQPGPIIEPSGDQPDWLKQPGQDEQQPAQPVSTRDEQPDWLKQFSGEPEPVKAEPPSNDFAFIDELKMEEPQQPFFPAIPRKIDTGDLGKSEQERDDSFAWLESLAAKQGATEGLLTKPEERFEQEPEWVKQAKGLNEQQPLEQLVVPVSTEGDFVQPVEGIEELGRSEQERDDSFAWLENLAAKQGATEGLLTKPEERLVEEPEWVKQAKGLSEPQPLEHPVVPGSTEEVGVQPIGNIDEPGRSDQERDDSLVWPENLAVEQGPEGVKQAEEIEEGQVSVPPMDQGLVSSIDTAAWLRSLDQEESIQMPVTESAGDDTAMWLRSLDDAEAKFEPVVDSSNDDTAMWLKSLDEPKINSNELTDAESELPAWMQNVDEEKTASITDSVIPASDIPDDTRAADVQESVESKEEPETFEAPRVVTGSLPSWLRGLDEEKTNFPAGQDDLPAWLRDETGEAVAEPVKIQPTLSTDWQPIEELESNSGEILEPQEKPKSVPVASKPKRSAPKKSDSRPVTPVEIYKEPVTRKGSDMLTQTVDVVLEQGRSELSRSNIPAALETYAKLIKRGRFLDEVIHDLREALYRYPVEVSIWQSLGDAYMRANRLQDALDAYTKAEELLR